MRNVRYVTKIVRRVVPVMLGMAALVCLAGCRPSAEEEPFWSGADISGIGSNMLTVRGVKALGLGR